MLRLSARFFIHFQAILSKSSFTAGKFLRILSNLFSKFKIPLGYSKILNFVIWSSVRKSAKSLYCKICYIIEKLLPSEKSRNILDFDKESKRKLLSLISAGSFINDLRVQIFFMPKWKIFWFQKTFIKISWIFSCNKCIIVRLWLKLFISHGWMQTEITVHNIKHFNSVLIPYTLNCTFGLANVNRYKTGKTAGI